MANGDSTSGPIITDGGTVFSGGIDSLKVTTVQGNAPTGGLRRDQLAWLINGTVRDGGISQRHGFQPICKIADGDVLYQHGRIYEPDGALPYIILSLSGNIFRVDPTTATVANLSGAFGLSNPPTAEKAYFCQAEQFMVIQGGDYQTLPLFWDGNILRRSIGITNTAIAAGTPGVNEIPASGPMDYYQGRLWYAQDRTYSAGDIVGGNSGSLAYQFRDAVLNVTENPLVVGGDGFTVPDNEGNIRALSHSANIDTALGQGLLYIFTRKAVYSLEVPVTRYDWRNADANNQPRQNVVQMVNGSVNDASIVAVNGDLYFQSFEPGIRSLVAAIRYFQQPGNIQISANERRILQYNDRALLKFASGIEFDNRLLMTALPFQTPVGVAHRALVPLDFVPVSSFNEEYSPVWEGHYEGIDILQLFEADFAGLQRAFAVVWSRTTGEIWLWEIVKDERFDDGDKRITMQMEFPAFTWDKIKDLKKMVGGELWIDRLRGTAEIIVDYRVDGEACWVNWLKFKVCSAKNSSEFRAPLLEPYPTECGPGYRQTIDFPAPPMTCSQMQRTSNIGYQFQPRLTIHGSCRVRGIFLHAIDWPKKLYDRLPCDV